MRHLYGSRSFRLNSVWHRGLRLKLRPLPNGLHSVREGPDDRTQPCVSDVDSPVVVHLFDLSALFDAQAIVGNRSFRPTRIDVGSRSARSVGSSRVMTWTATPLPSGNGSETISNRLPYILMWWEELYPRALILTQSSAVDLAILWFTTVPISCDRKSGNALAKLVCGCFH